MTTLWLISTGCVAAVALYALATIIVLHATRHTSEAGKWVLGSVFVVFGALSLFLLGLLASIAGGSDPLRIGRWLASIGAEPVVGVAVVSVSALVARVVHYVATREAAGHGPGAPA